MKIDKLIDKLKNYNQKATITLTTSEDIMLSYVCEDNDGNELSKKNTPLVFIEGCDTNQRCCHYDDEYCNIYKRNCENVSSCSQFKSC